MPSGMLCRVTASTSSVVRFQGEATPSALAAPACRWGSRASIAIRKRIPSRNPPAAGSQPGMPDPSAWSMAGISRLHTEAAIITPAANPRKMRCTSALILFLKKKTRAAPRVVIRKVKPVPPAAQSMDCAVIKITSKILYNQLVSSNMVQENPGFVK